MSSPSVAVDYIREPRQLVVGGSVANRLGLQVFRTIADHSSWSLRKTARGLDRSLSSHVEELNREGVLVIRNFLPDAAFSAIKAEVAQAMLPPAEHWRRHFYGDNFVSDQILVTYFPELFPALCQHVQQSEFIGKLAAAVSRRRLTYRPHMMVQAIQLIDWSKPHVDLDYNQFSHVDRHYPFMKAFFYLEDVDEATAPYCYARRSHRVTLDRLRHEYQYSVCHARARAHEYERTPAQIAADSELVELNEAYLRRIGTATEPIVGKANTLIISNNQGFHRRAPLVAKRRRLMVVSDYKFLEARGAQLLYPILKHAYRD